MDVDWLKIPAELLACLSERMEGDRIFGLAGGTNFQDFAAEEMKFELPAATIW